ncbi:hypothetical protein ECANGB1_960 [Enterospora canceri]|uniref:RRM domain-containing protein n=1 Tax=Enterospora canceri TaxID=1081671 RepID=A0A1Y1S716_9MICR|nr:hypothetical protein ECANGB1_960 [Enterospora canceri]
MRRRRGSSERESERSGHFDEKRAYYERREAGYYKKERKRGRGRERKEMEEMEENYRAEVDERNRKEEMKRRLEEEIEEKYGEEEGGRSRKLMLVNLSVYATEEDVAEALEEEGIQGMQLRVLVDRRIGLCNGIGFVTLQNEEVAERAAAVLRGKEIKGRKVKVRGV